MAGWDFEFTAHAGHGMNQILQAEPGQSRTAGAVGEWTEVNSGAEAVEAAVNFGKACAGIRPTLKFQLLTYYCTSYSTSLNNRFSISKWGIILFP